MDDLRVTTLNGTCEICARVGRHSHDELRLWWRLPPMRRGPMAELWGRLKDALSRNKAFTD